MLFRRRLGGRKNKLPLESIFSGMSFKDQLTWNQKSVLFVLSWARNQNLSLVLALFWPITHVLCHLNIDLLKFATQVYDVYKHMHKQFTFFCFGKGYPLHTSTTTTTTKSIKSLRIKDNLFLFLGKLYLSRYWLIWHWSPIVGHCWRLWIHCQWPVKLVS